MNDLLNIKIKRLLNSTVLKCITLVSIAFIGAFYVGYVYRGDKFEQYLDQFKPLRKGVAGFALINPLVGIDSPNAFNVGLYSDTRKKLQHLIGSSRDDGLLAAGIYYRDLNSSVWFGLDQDEEFVPASLLKMTYALAAYRESEDDRSFLDKQIMYTQDTAEETKRRGNADTDTSLSLGQLYSARQLVEIMLIKSDNGARDALQNMIDKRYLDEVFAYLGINVPEAVNDFQISTADYALFFRMLYGSTFINEKNSEELLSVLTKTDFPYGITQYIPSRVATAHKWGVYNFPPSADGTALQELHDCGIVYETQKPYLICIMSKGTNQEILSKFIAEASRIIYEDTVTDGQ